MDISARILGRKFLKWNLYMQPKVEKGWYCDLIDGACLICFSALSTHLGIESWTSLNA